MSLIVFATCLQKNLLFSPYLANYRNRSLVSCYCCTRGVGESSWFPFIKFSFWNNQDCSKHWPKKEGSFHELPVMLCSEYCFCCKRYERLIINVTRIFRLFRWLIFSPKISHIQGTAAFREKEGGGATLSDPTPPSLSSSVERWHK